MPRRSDSQTVRQADNMDTERLQQADRLTGTGTPIDGCQTEKCQIVLGSNRVFLT